MIEGLRFCCPEAIIVSESEYILEKSLLNKEAVPGSSHELCYVSLRSFSEESLQLSKGGIHIHLHAEALADRACMEGLKRSM
jgi:hypothetical protein